METHLKIIGYLLMVLGLIHVGFPKYFEWKKELPALSMFNRQMLVVHAFFIALTVFLMGLLCVLASKDLLSTGLGRIICTGLAVFWTTRAVIQFFGYSPDLWKGKPFETSMHILFSMFWVYMSVVFITVAVG